MCYINIRLMKYCEIRGQNEKNYIHFNTITYLIFKWSFNLNLSSFKFLLFSDIFSIMKP